jgi:cytidylate kinase
VVEGRDITTVVFPHATVKVFLTASLEERTLRRGEEGADSVARRDRADSTRAASPLRRADDALVLDTTDRDVDDVVQEIVQCLKSRSSS